MSDNRDSVVSIRVVLGKSNKGEIPLNSATVERLRKTSHLIDSIPEEEFKKALIEKLCEGKVNS